MQRITFSVFDLWDNSQSPISGVIIFVLSRFVFYTSKYVTLVPLEKKPVESSVHMFYCHLNNRKAKIVEIEFLPKATRFYNRNQTVFSKNSGEGIFLFLFCISAIFYMYNIQFFSNKAPLIFLITGETDTVGFKFFFWHVLSYAMHSKPSLSLFTSCIFECAFI